MRSRTVDAYMFNFILGVEYSYEYARRKVCEARKKSGNWAPQGRVWSDDLAKCIGCKEEDILLALEEFKKGNKKNDSNGT